MSKFVHVDPSLHGVGGHEYDSALSILQAAEAAGYEVALVASRRFRNRSGLPGRWPVYSLFPGKGAMKFQTSASDYIALDGSRLECATGNVPRRRRSGVLKSGLLAILDVDWFGCHSRRIYGFAKACRRLFRKLDLRQGDQVFFETISVFELLGLANYITDTPESQLADWHLQIHDDPFEGDGSSEADHLETHSAVRCQLQYILSHLPSHTLHLYNPTESLAAQYNQLGLATFRYLPYPVSPALRVGGNPKRKVLRVTCAGSVRREKGYRGLRALVTSLRDEPTFDGRLEFVAQLSRRKARRLGISTMEAGGRAAEVPLTVLPHVLETEAYRKLICRTDIGLFLYDRRRYRFRCSAVLQEMLAAGKPVIVPAGCWLADQIAEPIQCHLEKLQDALPTIQCLQGSDLTWCTSAQNVPALAENSGQLSFTDLQSIATEMPAPTYATELLISFRRGRTDGSDSYVSVQTEQFDSCGNLLKKFDTTVGRRPSEANVFTLHRLDLHAGYVKLRLSNAYTQKRLTVGDCQLRFLNSNATFGCPAGSVGLVATQHTQIPDLLHDMIEHYDHYRVSAEAFSGSWRRAHHPARTIEILTANARNLLAPSQIEQDLGN